MDTGERIKYYRKKANISAEELAERVGISPSTIYRYENNDIANMGIDKLKSIANALHTHAYILLGWDENISLPLGYEQIVFLLDKLSDEGVKRIEMYAEDLVASGKYKRINNDDVKIREDVKKECEEMDAEKERALSGS